MKGVIAILGMHRSGTSLAASILRESGVDVGEKLLRADVSNPAGHFEDLDILDFHKEVLEDNNISPFTGDIPALKLNGEQAQRARDIVARRNAKTLWGWKDPRTVLFIPLWKKLLPHGKLICVIVLRSPEETVRSMLARDQYKSTQYKRKTELPMVPFRLAAFNLKKKALAVQYYRSWLLHYKTIISEIIDPDLPHFIVRFEDLHDTRWVVKFNSIFDLGLNARGVPESRADYDKIRPIPASDSLLKKELLEVYTLLESRAYKP